MLLYIIIALILLCLAGYSINNIRVRVAVPDSGAPLFVYKKNNKNTEALLAFIMLLFFFVLTAFRGISIGNDTQNYVIYFEEIAKKGVDFSRRIEGGYQILCWLISRISDDPRFFLFAMALICYVGIGVYIYKYSNYKLFSVCLAFCICFSNFTNILRQDMAMIIILYAYQAIKKRKKLVPLLLILLAFTFHKTALIGLVFVFHRFYPRSFKAVAVLAVAIILLSVSGIINKILLSVLSSYTGYFEGNRVSSGYLATAVSVLRNFAFCYIIYKTYAGQRKKSVVVFCAFVLLIASCFGFSMNLFDRISAYFLFPMIVEIPNAFYTTRYVVKRRIGVLICFILLAYFVVSIIIRPEWNNLYPYEFWA